MTEKDQNGYEKIAGSIEYVKYSNPENGYAICDLGTSDDDIITVVGTMPYITEGDNIVAYGNWVHNPKYGRQFQVVRFERTMPADESAILRYLSSHALKGIGPKTAQKIVDMFGIETLEVIENHPDWLAQVPGISRKKAEEIGQEFKEKSGIRSAMMFFSDWFGTAMIVRIYKKWGSSAVDIAKANPYRLCDEIDGIGFERADQMARALSHDPQSDERLSSGIIYVLRSNSMQNGHTCLPADKLISCAAELLGTTPERVRDVIASMVASDRLTLKKFDGVSYIYDKYMYRCERQIADKLQLIDKLHLRVDAGDLEGFVRLEEARSGIKYANMQKRAIFDSLQNGVFILTGGPGTGKTTVIRALLDIFKNLDLRVALAAPTGRAAKRLSESTSNEAKTIHRLLEVEFGSDGDDYERSGVRFRKGEEDLLEDDVIIIDEASMVDCPLMSSLLKAVKPGARFIFIGDSDQLPSVGPGNVLKDLIDSGCFATVCLTEIFRQAQQSLIVTNAHAINDGKMPDLSVKDNDFFYLARQGDKQIADTIADLYENRLPRAYGEMARGGIQVISPSRRGQAGTENLNHLIQSIHNPASPEKREHNFRETIFREGDRVMQIKNNYDIEWVSEVDDREGMGIFNGDIGEIRRINGRNETMTIAFDDRIVEYAFDNLEELELAYCVTVHKSQGSEYPIVIIPAYHAPFPLLTRNLLYTAVTRARKMVIIVGEEQIIGQMVSNNRQSLRYTGLCRILKEY